MSATTHLVSQCRDQLDDGLEKGAQRCLGRDPRLGMRQRFEDPAAAADGSLDNPLVNQEKKDGGFPAQLHTSPVTGPAKVILQMQANVPDGLLDQCAQVLVISMVSIMSETAG